MDWSYELFWDQHFFTFFLFFLCAFVNPKIKIYGMVSSSPLTLISLVAQKTNCISAWDKYFFFLRSFGLFREQWKVKEFHSFFFFLSRLLVFLQGFHSNQMRRNGKRQHRFSLSLFRPVSIDVICTRVSLWWEWNTYKGWRDNRGNEKKNIISEDPTWNKT